MKVQMAPGGWGFRTTPAGTAVWRYIIMPDGSVRKVKEGR